MFPNPMHGTGDIFASVLSGALVRGASIEQALSIAVNFTADTIQATLPDLRTLPREGSTRGMVWNLKLASEIL